MSGVSKHYNISSNGIFTIATVPLVLTGLLIGVDAVNDPSVTIYDSPTAISGDEVIPETPFDASALELKGFVNFKIHCPKGITVKVSTLGTGEVIVYYYVK